MITKKGFATVVAHILFILIIFVLPELMMTLARPHRLGGYIMAYYVKTLVYVAAFYINYFYIVGHTIGRLDGRRHLARFLGLNLLVLVAGVVVCHLAGRYLAPHRHGTDLGVWKNVIKSTSFLLRDGGMIILSIGLAVALRLAARWQDVERQRQRFLAEQRATELEGLKSQINPHFLFNTLNTIYVLVDVAPDHAKDAVHRLSGLLRYMLYEDVRAVRLEQEADFIRDYVTLMKLRISRRPIDVCIDLAGHEQSMVPPLLFIPLIENAFKYGNSADDATPISISLHVEDGAIVCRTSNSFVPVPEPAGRRDSGIGIANLQRRLQLLYGARAELTRSVTGDIYDVCLSLPLQ